MVFCTKITYVKFAVSNNESHKIHSAVNARHSILLKLSAIQLANVAGSATHSIYLARTEPVHKGNLQFTAGCLKMGISLVENYSILMYFAFYCDRLFVRMSTHCAFYSPMQPGSIFLVASLQELQTGTVLT